MSEVLLAKRPSVEKRDILDLEWVEMTEWEQKGGIIDGASLFNAFWYWCSWSCPDVSCPRCGSYSRYQDPEALDRGYSILVCRDCREREFDD